MQFVTSKLFQSIPEQDQKLLWAKLHHAIRCSNISLMSAMEIVEDAEARGLYTGVKFFETGSPETEVGPEISK